MEPDTRTFSSLRLRSFHGYGDSPKVDSGFDFKLPPITRYHARVVKQREERWMVWSANSRQDPFYPGARTMLGLVATAAENVHRRYDGQGGRWDYTKVPQVYNAVRPWLAFIRREDLPNHSYVEYTPVYSVWVSSATTAGGELSSEFRKSMVDRNKQLDREILALQPRILNVRPRLCTYRPQFPDLEKLRTLDNANFYERALDLVTECQRGMKEKQAWLVFAEKWLAAPPYVPLQRDCPIIPADDAYIGVWINGALEEDVHWFLTIAGAPCFVINAMSKEEPDCVSFSSFAEGTWFHPYLVDHLKYNYDRIGSDSLDLFTEEDPHVIESNPPQRTLEQLQRSSLRWQMGLAPNQVLLLDCPTEIPAADVDEPMPLVAKNSPCGPSLPVPPVAAEALDRGSWVIFAQGSDEEIEDMMIKRGATKKGKGEVSDDEELWWDRELKRKLIFSDLIPPPDGLTTDDEFGRPVPAWPFVMNANGKWKKEKPSTWMYRRERPNPNYVGKIPPPPTQLHPPVEAEVPRNPSTSGEEGEDSAASPSEQAVSLGSESEEEPLRPLTPPADSDDHMRSRSPETRARSLSPLVDGNGRWPTSFLRLLGVGMLYSTERLREWLNNINATRALDQSVRVQRVFRAMRADVGVDYLIEVEGIEDAMVLYEHASANDFVTRGVFFMTAVEFSNEARIHSDLWMQGGSVDQLNTPELAASRVPPSGPRRVESRGYANSGGSYGPHTPLPRWPTHPSSRINRWSSSSQGKRRRSPSPDRFYRPTQDRWSHRDSRNRGHRSGSRDRRNVRWSTSPRSRSRERSPIRRRLASPHPTPAPRAPSPIVHSPAVRPSSVEQAMDVDVPNVPSGSSLLGRLSEPETPSVPVQSRSLLGRFSDPVNAVAGPSKENRSLLDRLRPADEELRGISNAEKALLRRANVSLSERVSTQTKPLRVRKHNRAKKRVEKLIVVDEELHAWQRLTEEFPWTDEEIDWFISMENLDFYDFNEFF